MAIIKNPYSEALIISYPEGDFSLERTIKDYPNNEEDLNYLTRDEDTLPSIAHYFYGDGRYWYVIADRNNLDDIFTLEIGKNLIIPSPTNID